MIGAKLMAGELPLTVIRPNSATVLPLAGTAWREEFEMRRSRVSVVPPSWPRLGGRASEEQALR
jgi:hypothetical protein